MHSSDGGFCDLNFLIVFAQMVYIEFMILVCKNDPTAYMHTCCSKVIWTFMSHVWNLKLAIYCLSENSIFLFNNHSMFDRCPVWSVCCLCFHFHVLDRSCHTEQQLNITRGLIQYLIITRTNQGYLTVLLHLL